jgi:hypothetical protein
MDNWKILPTTLRSALPLLIDTHYARRTPSVSYCFGLYIKDRLEGVVTFGTPPSATLRSGICGGKWASNVLELSRLVFKNNYKNSGSYLISRAMKKLPSPSVIVSFADIAQKHTGFVYQATNFFYCGLSANRTDWAIRGKEHLHGQTIADEFRGVANRSVAMREKYGKNFYLKPRSRKHRYIFFIGSKKEKKFMLKDLRYDILDYPKTNTDI